MGKRGQITFFIIIGVLIAGIAVFSLYSSSQSSTTVTDTTQTLGNLDENIFRAFFTDCLTKAGESGLWRLGLQGGYLSSDDLDLYNSVPYGQGLTKKFLVPIYANLGADVALDADVHITSDDPTDTRTLRVMEDPTAEVNYAEINAYAATPLWTGYAIQTEWKKHAFKMFEDCVDQGIGSFEVYADIDRPTEEPAYVNARDTYLNSDQPDFQYGALNYTTTRVDVQAQINDEDVQLLVTYHHALKTDSHIRCGPQEIVYSSEDPHRESGGSEPQGTWSRRR